MTKSSLGHRYRHWRRRRLEAPPRRWPDTLTTMGVVLLLGGAALLVYYVAGH